MAKHKSFKESFGILSNRLTCSVKVTSHFEPNKKAEFEGVWDTGAQISAVTPKVAQQLNLVAVDSWEVYGVASKNRLPVVLIDLILPNNNKIENIYAVIAEIGGGDILIGMNVISLGDFLITNKSNQTEFSFVTPSLEERLDLTKIANEINHKK